MRATSKQLIILVAISVFGCKTNNTSDAHTRSVSRDSLLSFSKIWKHDSLGCLNLRDAERDKILLEKMKLIGRDYSLLIQYLGPPNFIERMRDKTIYYYYLECGVSGKTSYDNFYCYFRNDSLFSYQRK